MRGMVLPGHGGPCSVAYVLSLSGFIQRRRARRVIDADHAELGGYRFEIGVWRISEGRDSLNARPNTLAPAAGDPA